MSDVKWTKEQIQAINEKGENILVAAAAGSGKTAVLVERIINKIINEKIDIDKILVVTFTKAAAAEMKARVLDAIYKKIEEMPEDKHLQKQLMLLSKANICTIDSFCLDVVKNNFFEIDISPNLKIGENTEIEILKQEALEDLFDEKYEIEDKSFLKLVNMDTSYKGDDQLKELILNIFNFVQSAPFPEEWLEEKIQEFNIENISFEKTSWGKILFNMAKDELENAIAGFEEELNRVKYEEDTEKICVILSEDIRKTKVVYETKTWNEMYEEINCLAFDRFSASKKVPDEIKEKVKNKRSKIKDSIKAINENVLYLKSEEACEEIKNMYQILLIVKDLTLEFMQKFKKIKQARNIIDFSDIEHYALEILRKGENKKHVCNKYKEKYEEILIDEYQDSNLVQEKILTAISKGNNIFMVGDVKQSIYKFRGGRPELFLEKYETYKLKEDLEKEDNLKIQLFKNFRSRENVLSLTNIIFDSIMSKALGDIDYTKEEYLNLGADYVEGENLKAEIHIIDLKDEEESIYKGEEKEEKINEKIDDIVLEAKFVASKIKELIENGYMVSNKDKTKRKITYKDIAILLRSTKALAPIYEQEISKLNLPVFCDTQSRILRLYRNTGNNEPSKNN